MQVPTYSAVLWRTYPLELEHRLGRARAHLFLLREKHTRSEENINYISHGSVRTSRMEIIYYYYYRTYTCRWLSKDDNNIIVICMYNRTDRYCNNIIIHYKRKLNNKKKNDFLKPSTDDVFTTKMRTVRALLRHCQHNTHHGEKVIDTGARCDQNNAK